MQAVIRPFEEADYSDWVRVFAEVFPDQPFSEEEARHHDRHRDPRCLLERFVAEWGEPGTRTVIGGAEISQSATSFHPRKFRIELFVSPAWQGRGIGRAFFAKIQERLTPRDPLALATWTQESLPRSLRFLQDRGFVEVLREWESRLDPSAFDPAPFADVEPRVLAQGLTIHTLAELRAADPDCNRKLYEAIWKIEEDVPRSDPEFTPPAFDAWLERHLANPNLLPEAQFIAVHQGRYVGISQLSRMQASPDLDTGLTGVLPEYRRRGIALALKLRAVAYARRVGAPAIRTWNETRNRGMLSINERLGFVKEPAWIEFVRRSDEAPAG
jgi:mycothiol synthase